MSALLHFLGYGLGLLCIIQAIVTWELGTESQSWPQCRGKIIEVVTSGKKDRKARLSSAPLYYSYAPHGKTMYSDCVTFGPTKLMAGDINVLGWVPPTSEQNQVEDFYLKKGFVNVYFKPEDPHASCLVRGCNVYWLIAYFLLAIAFAGSAFYFMRKAQKAIPPKPKQSTGLYKKR